MLMVRGTTLTIVMLASLLGSQAVLAASDVADAVMSKDSQRLEQLLASKKADVNAAQPDGTTALHWAAYYGDIDVAAKLLKARANPALTTGTGMTPLALACEAGNADLVKLLLKSKADPNQVLQNGETPLMMAARTGSVPVIELLLAKHASIDAREKLRGTTALMWAAANSNTDAVRLLIRKGADINARSATVSPGRRPYLADSGRARIEEFIKGVGQGGTVVAVDAPDAAKPADPAQKEAADRKLAAEREAAKKTLQAFPPDEDLKRGNKQWGGLTPLIFAARDGNIETVRALLDAGSCSNARPIRISQMKVAGIRSTSRPTTGTSKAATIPLASRTWITSSTSSCCSRPARIRISA
jgi:ankyrin repeat protein